PVGQIMTQFDPSSVGQLHDDAHSPVGGVVPGSMSCREALVEGGSTGDTTETTETRIQSGMPGRLACLVGPVDDIHPRGPAEGLITERSECIGAYFFEIHQSTSRSLRPSKARSPVTRTRRSIVSGSPAARTSLRNRPLTVGSWRIISKS